MKWKLTLPNILKIATSWFAVTQLITAIFHCLYRRSVRMCDIFTLLVYRKTFIFVLYVCIYWCNFSSIYSKFWKYESVSFLFGLPVQLCYSFLQNLLDSLGHWNPGCSCRCLRKSGETLCFTVFTTRLLQHQPCIHLNKRRERRFLGICFRCFHLFYKVFCLIIIYVYAGTRSAVGRAPDS